MDRKLIDAICQQVYKKFPEVNGAHPTVSDRPQNQILLVFSGKASAADGKSIPRIVRVAADETGKIVKITTSR